jgi:hypothetical protein
MGWKDVARLATGLVTELTERAQEAQQSATMRAPDPEPAFVGDPAELSITVSGGEQGTLVVTLPCARTAEDGGWALRLEAPDPVPLGSTALAALSLAVPAYDGPGRYDLGGADWEPFELHLAPVSEVDDRTWFADLRADPPPVIEIAPDSVSFDLPLASAVNAIRAVGTVRL